MTAVYISYYWRKWVGKRIALLMFKMSFRVWGGPVREGRAWNDLHWRERLSLRLFRWGLGVVKVEPDRFYSELQKA